MVTIIKSIYKEGELDYSTEYDFERDTTFEEGMKRAYDLADYFRYMHKNPIVCSTENGAMVDYLEGDDHCTAVYEVVVK